MKFSVLSIVLLDRSGLVLEISFSFLHLVAVLVFLQTCLGITGAFQNTGSMITPRLLHTATLLTNGKVLVTGGFADTLETEFLASAELYDPDSGTWTAAA